MSTSMSIYSFILILKEKRKELIKNMEITINEKTIKDTDFNGNTERLLEEIIYEFLNDDSTVMMARLEV